MPRYVALLRAINVGGHTVKMDRLRALFEELGFGGVRTVIASGNVLFDSTARSAPRLEERIASHLEGALGYAVATFVRTIPELQAAVAHQPFPPAEIEAAHALWIAFLSAAPDAAARGRVESLQTPTDALHVHGRELYWMRRVRESDPRLGRLLERAAGPMTARNITTVRTLAGSDG